MQWAAPAWLAAIAAIIVPIMLHLRDRRPPDIIRVGSTADLTSAVARRRRRRLEDIPLLLFRCAVVALAAALLAGPRLAHTATSGRRVAVVPSTMPLLRDSLREAGITVAAVTPSAFPWSIAAWADTAVDAGDTLLLATPTDARLYPGTRPVVRHPVSLLTVESDTAGGVAVVPVQLMPRRAGAGAPDIPLRDARDASWWVLLAAIVAERVLASRRRA